MNQIKDNKAIGYWLLIGVLMLIIQVLLGGITRLTGSGLSITEWQPILGSIPPMNDIAWEKAFDMYKEKTGQYKYLNNDFTLSDFKFIYFWEWFHRNWARLISIVFIIPFLYFLYHKKISRTIALRLLVLFFLGIAQGLIGWIMVKSGLTDDKLYVSHIKLAIHFISALVLISITMWYALALIFQNKETLTSKNLRYSTISILVLLFFQLIYGAFMAGAKAATVATSWPLINGDIFPPALLQESWIHHKINIQFIHRTMAYLICITTIIWTWYAVKNIPKNHILFKYRFAPIIFILLQTLLGILAITNATQTARNGFHLYEYIAQAHQLIAMFFLMMIVTILFFLKWQKVNS